MGFRYKSYVAWGSPIDSCAAAFAANLPDGTYTLTNGSSRYCENGVQVFAPDFVSLGS